MRREFWIQDLFEFRMSRIHHQQFTGALRHVTKRRLKEAQQDHIDAKLTAVISGDGEPISSSYQPNWDG